MFPGDKVSAMMTMMKTIQEILYNLKGYDVCHGLLPQPSSVITAVILLIVFQFLYLSLMTLYEKCIIAEETSVLGSALKPSTTDKHLHQDEGIETCTSLF